MNEKVVQRWVAGVAVGALLIVSPLAFRHAPSSAPAINETGQLAKLDFTLKDMNGKDVRLSDFKGRPILLNFWATWCGPCKEEIPTLIALNENYKSAGPRRARRLDRRHAAGIAGVRR